MALNIELSVDGVVIPQVNGVYTLDNLTLYDFGRTIQIKIKNLDTIPLKDHYVMIIQDSTLSSFGQRCVSLSYADGTGVTQENKLYLKNNNMLTNQEEIFQLIFTFPYGVNSIPNMSVGLAISNYVINAPVFQR